MFSQTMDSSKNNLNTSCCDKLLAGAQAVVPFPMKLVPLEGQFSKLFVRHLEPSFVGILVQLGPNVEPCFGGRAADQIDHDLAADQGASAPVVGDVAEHPMLDRVPLAGSGWKVTDLDLDAELIGQLLQLAFPQAIPVAAATIRRNQHAAGLGIAWMTHFFPPAPDAFDGEFGGVVIDPNADPTLIGGDIVDAVGRDLAEVRINEIIDANFLRLSFWLPFLATVLEIADQFLLLGVDGNHRITSRLVLRRRASDMGELGVPVRMAFPGLAGRLETVAKCARRSQTLRWLTWWPCSANSFASRGVLLHVQRNGDCGSPRGSTKASRSRRRPCRSVSYARPLRRGCDAYWRHRQPLAGPMKAAAIPGLSNRNRSSFATGRWPSPRCSRHPVPGCGPQQQPTDATRLHPAVPPEPDACPRSSLHHSYPKSEETTQSVQVIFAGVLRRETRATQVISGCHSGSSWCRRPRPIDAPGDAAGGCRRGGARRRAWPVFHAGWAGSASPGPAGHFGGPREAVLLTMQGIGGEQHAGQAQVLHQRRHGRDLAPATSWWARMRAASLAKALST